MFAGSGDDGKQKYVDDSHPSIPDGRSKPTNVPDEP